MCGSRPWRWVGFLSARAIGPGEGEFTAGFPLSVGDGLPSITEDGSTSTFMVGFGFRLLRVLSSGIQEQSDGISVRDTFPGSP